MPHGRGFGRAIVYGDGWLWLTAAAGEKRNVLTRLNPVTGNFKNFKTRDQGGLAWSGDYGGLWMTAFEDGTVSLIHRTSGRPHRIASMRGNPWGIVVLGDDVWVGDWASPTLWRFSAVAPDIPAAVHLRVKTQLGAGVTTVAADGRYIWATVPDDHAVYRIDPKTNQARRIGLKYNPWGVGAGDDGIWVTLRAQDA